MRSLKRTKVVPTTGLVIQSAIILSVGQCITITSSLPIRSPVWPTGVCWQTSSQTRVNPQNSIKIDIQEPQLDKVQFLQVQVLPDTTAYSRKIFPSTYFTYLLHTQKTSTNQQNQNNSHGARSSYCTLNLRLIT